MRKRMGLVLLALCGLAVAQMGMDPFAMTRNIMTSTGNLMNQNDFRKELKLTGDQNKKVTALAKAHQKGMQDISKKAQSSGADMATMAATLKEMETLDSDTDKAIFAELTPEQTRRLTQIRWQILGVKSIYEPELQKELGLSEEQIGKLNEWKRGESERMMALVQASRSPNAMKEARKKIKADDETAILGVLLSEQVERYKAALGPESKAARRMSETLH